MTAPSERLATTFASIDWEGLKRALRAMSRAFLAFGHGTPKFRRSLRRSLRRTETPKRSAMHAEYRRKTRHRNRNRRRR